MKAIINTHTKPAVGKGRFSGHELRLTVGMIVKNEGETLERCLSSMKPLLDAVPSELIITDTGSTDNTVEIAQKYTDHILYFKWCDDFSAARNTGLSIARGEWFMFIDGDEWFENVAPLIDFFNDGECDKYNTAGFGERNYTDFTGKKYIEDHTCRLYRTFPGIAYKNKVHEDLPLNKPIKMLDAYLHHYGYAYKTKEEKQAKIDRNLALLEEELKENPEDRKALVQISGQLLKYDDAKAAEYAQRGMALTVKEGGYVYLRLAISYLKAEIDLEHYQTALDSIPKILEKAPQKGYFHLEFYRLGQIAAYILKQYAKSAEYGKLSLELYEDAKQGRLDDSEQLFCRFDYLTEEKRQKCLFMLGKAFIQRGYEEEAQRCLEKMDIFAPEVEEDEYYELCFDIARAKRDWLPAVELMQKLQKKGSAKGRTLMTYTDTFCENCPSERAAVLRAFADTDDDGDYFVLCRIRLAEDAGDRKQAVRQLEILRGRDTLWNVQYADALFCILREKVNLVPFLVRMDTDDIASLAVEARRLHEKDFGKTAAEYSEAYSFENPKALYIAICLLETAVLHGSPEAEPALYGKLVRFYMENSAKYVRALYRPEMFSAANLPTLPRVYRFGYYAGQALGALHEGDGARYLAGLRNALREYPPMDRAIQFLLNCFEREQRDRTAKTKEFAALAGQVKARIEALIEQGDLQQAAVYTLQLAELIPEDDDIRRYRKLTNTEPSMEEIASKLPQ